jgi:hypothetical protein
VEEEDPDFTDRVKMLIREREQVAHVREVTMSMSFEACLDVYAPYRVSDVGNVSEPDVFLDARALLTMLL